MHTARSRNDQVATDFKLWVREACVAADAALGLLQVALVTRAGEHAASIMPGFTHLQTAQPVTLGHHLMAYYEMLGRDRSRFVDAHRRASQCPLGSAALAGTGFPIDRDATAAALGFAMPTPNSLDSVSDRDFALDYLMAASQCALHLSRLAEELILWASQPFGFVMLPDALSTGSSIMPQKKNPDAAELVRGHSGRIAGCLTGLMMTMKGLPLAYSKDMQDDKPPVFEAAGLLMLSLAAMEGMVAGATFRTDRMRAAAELGYATATDLADWLVREAGVPFREAHHITGAAVKLAEKPGDCTRCPAARRLAGDRSADQRGGLCRAFGRGIGGGARQLWRNRAAAGKGAGGRSARGAGSGVIAMRRLALPLLVLMLAACGQRTDLKPLAAEGLPVAPYGREDKPSAEALLDTTPQAEPERSVELRKRSEERTLDPFDLPPSD